MNPLEDLMMELQALDSEVIAGYRDRLRSHLYPRHTWSDNVHSISTSRDWCKYAMSLENVIIGLTEQHNRESDEQE